MAKRDPSSDHRRKAAAGKDVKGRENRATAPERFLADYLDFHAAQLSQNADYDLEGPDALLAYAARAGKILEESQIVYFTQNPVGGGVEHEVFASVDSDRVNRITRGKKFGHNGDDEVGYLSRLRDLNRLSPGLDIRVEGVIDRKGWPALVTSMKQLEGTHPSERQLEDYMASKGFRSTGRYSYEHPNGIELGDLHPKNVIRDEDGRMIPFDVMIYGDVEGALSRYFESE
jgi:hypothetical protein